MMYGPAGPSTRATSCVASVKLPDLCANGVPAGMPATTPLKNHSCAIRLSIS